MKKKEKINIPPYSIEAEEAILGGILIDNSVWDEISGNLETNDFYKSNNKRIFKTLNELYEEDKPLDIITVSEKLKKKKELEKIGGLEYLNKLIKNASNTTNIFIYTKIVREKSSIRKLISISKNIIDISLNKSNKNINEIFLFIKSKGI